MNPFGVILVLFLIIGAVLVYRWYIRDLKEIVSEWDASKGRKILTSERLSLSKTRKYSFSVWLYLTEWKSTNANKHIIRRVTSGTAIGDDKTEMGSGSSSLSNVYYHMELDHKTNSLRCYTRLTNEQPKFSTCEVPNIPIQRWVNIITTTDGGMMDIYVDGKLFKHCEFEKTHINIPDKTDVHLLGGAPFQGKLSKVEYIRDFIRPQRAWDIYVDGPRDSSIIGNWLNRYMLRIQWLKDGSVEREYKI